MPLYTLQRPTTNTWREEFYAEARTNALKLLATDWSDAVAGTAGLLAIYSINKEPDPLIAALDRQLERLRKDGDVGPKEGPRWASGYLMRALEEQANLQIAMPEQPKTPGEVMAFLTGVSSHADFSPQGWQEIFERALAHELAVVRESALRRLPRPLPREMNASVIRLMTDPDKDVRKIACERVATLKLPGGREQALKSIVMSPSSEDWTIGMAVNSAVRDGGRVECAEMMAKRFAEEAGDRNYRSVNVFMRHLVEITVGGYTSGDWNFLQEPGGKAKAEQLRDEWLKVIRHHAEDLRAGRQLLMGQGMVTVDLVPPGVTYQPPHK